MQFLSTLIQGKSKTDKNNFLILISKHFLFEIISDLKQNSVGYSLSCTSIS